MDIVSFISMCYLQVSTLGIDRRFAQHGACVKIYISLIYTGVCCVVEVRNRKHSKKFIGTSFAPVIELSVVERCLLKLKLSGVTSWPALSVENSSMPRLAGESVSSSLHWES